jgi:hypothetical protein
MYNLTYQTNFKEAHFMKFLFSNTLRWKFNNKIDKCSIKKNCSASMQLHDKLADSKSSVAAEIFRTITRKSAYTVVFFCCPSAQSFSTAAHKHSVAPRGRKFININGASERKDRKQVHEHYFALDFFSFVPDTECSWSSASSSSRPRRTFSLAPVRIPASKQTLAAADVRAWIEFLQSEQEMGVNIASCNWYLFQ